MSPSVQTFAWKSIGIASSISQYWSAFSPHCREKSKDPNEILDVITVSTENEKGIRLEFYHARVDGTSTQKLSQAGGGK
jgi:hypothetical protein